MIIRFDRELSRQEIYANGAELAQVMGIDRDDSGKKVSSWPKDRERFVASFENPVLVTDTYRIAQLDPTKRDTIFKLHESLIRTIEYDGTSMDFEQARYPTVWSPSIDTLFFCRSLESIDLVGVKTAIELGSGSGFISKRLLERAPELKYIELVDVNPEAIACSKEEIIDERARFFVGNGEERLDGKRKYDLILCNPPYVPRPRELGGSAYEGVGLLVRTIEGAADSLNAGGSLVINYSSLCERTAIEASEKSGLEYWKRDEMDVPLKVCNILNNPEWMSFLESRGLRKNPHEGYEYWHTLNISEFQKD